MASERIFNIFVYFESGIARSYGLRHHRLDGTDLEKQIYLKGKIDADFQTARHFPLSRSFTNGEWFAQQRIGIDIGLFEEGFAHYRAGPAPILCLTAIVDGIPKADEATELLPYWGEKIGKGLPGDMEDWLVKYTEGNLIRFDKLINDDYFVAIKLLFNARHIASAAKLLMSCIDTMAFIEHGDEQGNFIKWLESYVELGPLKITAKELWQFRNSIVHMTNLSSRAVLAGKVSPIMPYIGCDDLAVQSQAKTIKPFNFHRLILAVATGIGKWTESYNVDRDKFIKFVERYDTVISDSRLAVITVEHST